ncbi:MAG: hypothetical protein M0Z38_08835 [Deltaproteobacteria bacterium]|nr:hypothetical protein [Deltaproteobacteria bacterium]
MKTPREWMQDRRVAAALAAVAVLFVVYRFYPKGAGKTPPPAPAGAEMTPSPQDIPSGSGPTAVAGGVAAPAPGAVRPLTWSWKRNPFLPEWREQGAFSENRPGGGAAENGAVPGGVAEPPMGLRGTVITGNSGIAIFGSRLVPVGGRVGEWIVERVDPYSVALRSGKEVRVVELYKPSPSGGRGGGGTR